MKKEEAKKNISKLVEKYEKLKSENKLKQYNEAQTRAEFIEPLFGILGWDMKNWNNPNEVTTEESISNKRVDLAFRINGIPKFFLEAKPLKADLDVESYSRQAINYSWNKGVNWAVLTDFESLKLYNAQAKSKSLQDKLVFEIPCEEFISDFDRLRLLSKESFQNNELDKYAEKYGKKLKKQTVDEKLYDDLRTAREILTKSFGAWNENVDKETLDEGVQRILDRLVFIRVLEDKKLEEPILQPLAREWHQKHLDKQLFPMMIEKFRELNDIYNSNLFTKHTCEDWEEYDDAVRKVIDLLYGTDMFEYDFKQIPADILGGVYESYLGYIAQNPIEVDTDKKSGRLLKVEDKKELKLKSRKKRKEQGIYYTPKYIVDYIVKETLGRKLEEAKSINDLKQLKVLDPACGSGSFLTKALETINDKYRDFSDPGNQATKTQILTENIHGVDLDPQAVELAKLNLLIDALDKKDKLPDLTENVRIGNSLISGSEEELKKYFGKNWRDKKPFNWKEEFSSVMKQGGFDVIIGNPPYIRVDNLELEDKELWKQSFIASKGKYDLYYLFIEKSLSLLKEGGVLGFIVPNKFCVADSAKELRKLILKLSRKSKFLSVSRLDVFKDASNYPVILILTKGEDSQNIELGFAETEQEILSKSFVDYKLDNNLADFLPENIIPINVEKNKLELVINMIKKSENLGEYLKISEGLRISEKLESKDAKEYKIVKQYQFDRYSQIQKGEFISEDNLTKAVSRNSERFKNSFKEKIVIAEDALRITATLDKEKHLPQGGVYFATLKKQNTTIEYMLALLNSSLFSFVYNVLFGGMHMGGGYLRYRTAFLEKLPVLIAQNNTQRILGKFAASIIVLNKQIQLIPENSEKWKYVKREIEKVDKEINQKVYDLYGLTEEEVKIIENY